MTRIFKHTSHSFACVRAQFCVHSTKKIKNKNLSVRTVTDTTFIWYFECKFNTN